MYMYTYTYIHTYRYKYVIPLGNLSLMARKKEKKERSFVLSVSSYVSNSKRKKNLIFGRKKILFFTNQRYLTL